MGGAGIWALLCLPGLAEELLLVQANPREEAKGFALVGIGPGAEDTCFLLLPPSLVLAPGKSREGLLSCQLCPS